jgi:filamentous hemagglutinin family protein
MLNKKFMSLLAASVFTWVGAAAGSPAMAGELPVACSPCALPVGAPIGWVTSGTATKTTTATGMVINAGTAVQPNVTLNWQSFNISAGNTVQFVQPNATAVALNKIYQADPSRIFGNLTANGQVYLLNQNGIIFGNPDGTPVQINTGGLIASSLDISADAAKNGILSPIQSNQAAFSGTTGFVQINSGATLKTADGGRVALFAPVIENDGHIETPNGQTLLAAGQSVFLQSSDDPNLRGLLVEVNTGGSVTNTGSILSQEGNITLAGLAVNQQGRLTATTSVTKGGSIRLLARDTTGFQVGAGGRHLPVAENAGSLQFGAGSVTEVTLDTKNGETAVDDQPQPQSLIEGNGKTIQLQGNAALIAHGGKVELTAQANPSLSGTTAPANSAVQIDMDSGSRIDVSGGSVTVPMSRNQVTVQLRGNELRDSPLQRDGVLRGQTVTIDARVGTPLADVSGYLSGTIKRDVEERMAQGGSVKLISEGGVNLAAGSVIDISGGAVSYTPGFVDTTKLISNGRVYDIGSAPPDIVYSALFGGATIFQPKWGVTTVYPSQTRPVFQPGYTDGQAAGSVQIAGHTLQLTGDITAHTVNGIYQRTAATLPSGGQLTIGLPGGQSTGGADFVAPSLLLTEADQTVAADVANLALGRYVAAGVSVFNLYSNGSIALPSGNALVLTGGGRLSLNAPTISIGSDVTVAGGTITATSLDVDRGASLSADPRLAVAAGVHLDVSGQWINDLNNGAATTPLLINGGALSLRNTAEHGALSLGEGVVLSADSGAALSPAGALSGGNGGSLSLVANGQGSTLAIGAGTTLHAWGIANGGSLAITAPSLTVQAATTGQQDLVFAQSQSSTASSPLLLAADIFQQGGFSRYALSANQGDLRVQAGAHINALTSTRLLSANYLGHASGDDLAGFATIELLPDYLRHPASISLSTALLNDTFMGNLVVETGATVHTDPLGRITATATGGSLYMDGQMTAAGGTISLAAKQFGSQDFDPAFAVWLGPHALLDVSGTVTRQPLASASGDELNVLGAGRISLSSSGYLVAEQGSTLRANGAVATGDVQTVGYIDHLLDRSGGNQQLVGSSGGSIALSAAEGLVLDGAIEARAGASGYAAGDLSLSIDRSLRTGNILDPAAGFPADPARLMLTSAVQQQAGGLSFGDALSTSTFNGLAMVSTSALNASGIDSLTLKGDQIVFSGADPLALSMGRQLTLNAPQVVADGPTSVTLTAPSLVFRSAFRTPLATATAGTSTLVANGGNIDLAGAITLSGFNKVSLLSSGDIRLRGGGGAADRGALSTTGRLTLGARRIYPGTLTSFAINVVDSSAGPGTIDIESMGAPLASNEQLLTAGGNLSMTASTINQNGVLEAPLGTISLNAMNGLTLGPHSMTSVHANSDQILLGRTVNLADWYYSYGGTAALTSSDQLFGSTVRAFPEKRISLTAGSLNVTHGAVVDYSGGGDVVAYEQIPGPGGSVDALALANAGSMFAILPAQQGNFGPIDPAEFAQWGLTPGAAVTLYQGVGNLAPGTYAILPPRYALLAGAYLITPQSGYSNMNTGQTVALQNGAVVVPGVSTTLGSGLQTGAVSGFAVQPGSYAYQLAEYHLTSADKYLPGRAAELGLAVPRLPQDAGALVIGGQGALKLDGSFVSAPATAGRKSLVDITADNLSIVQSLDEFATVTEITAGNLANLGAGSLLLGGTRTAGATGTTLNAQARTVLIDAGVTLDIPELILIAKDSVQIAGGVQLSSSGTVTGVGTHYLTNGDSARVLVSNAHGSDISAQYSPGALQGQQGVVSVDSGATIAASGSIVLDGARDLLLNGTLDPASGATLSLGASAISLGDGAAGGSGLVLSTAALARFANVDLTLKSRGAITISSPLTLSTDTLVLDTPELVGSLTDPAGSAAISAAHSLTLRNSSGLIAAGGAEPTQGTLSLAAVDLTLDSANLAIDGFSQIALAGSHSIVGRGQSAFNYQGSLVATTPLLTVADGADLGIVATTSGGQFRLDAPAGSSAVPPSPYIGGSLVITADQIQQFGDISLPSGRIALQGAHGVTLGAGSYTGAGGVDVTFPGSVAHSAAGQVTLHALAGDVGIEAGARVDLSGSALGSDAGQLTVLADMGNLNIDPLAMLMGASTGSTATSADFSMDVQNLSGTDFSALNRQLGSVGFNGARLFRYAGAVPTVSLDAGTDVNVREFQLTVEQGGVELAGHLTINNPTGIARAVINARDDVHIAATGSVTTTSAARGTTEAEIDLASASGGIHVDAGAQLSTSAVNATGSAGGGLVHYRLSRDALAAGGLVVDGTTSSGTRQLVEGYQAYTLADGLVDSEVAANTGNALYQDSVDFMNSAAAQGLLARGFAVAPGIELLAPGDLTFASGWDLSAWRFNAAPGFLSVRAGGSINVNHSISDGFASADPSAALRSDASWSISLSAGADITSADRLRLSSQPIAGNLVVAADTLIRTGTGDLRLAAAGNVELQGSVNLGDPYAQATVYTAGRLAGHELDANSNPAGARKYLPVEGGALSISAGQDILGSPSDFENTQLYSEWYKRQPALLQENGGLWISYADFQQNFAAFGGGDLSLSAGRDIVRVAASVPVTGSYDAIAAAASYYGSGSLSVSAGHDIASGMFMVGQGAGTIRAGGSLTATGQGLYGGSSLGTVLAAMDGSFDVRTRGDLLLETVLNPTVISQVNQPDSQTANFLSYSAGARVSLESTTGAITLQNNPASIVANDVSGAIFQNSDKDLVVYPGTLSALAPRGDINIDSGMYLAPAAGGNLTLRAYGNIRNASAEVALSDLDPALLPSLAHPDRSGSGYLAQIHTNLSGSAAHGAPGPHQGDGGIANLVAATGDVAGGFWFISRPALLFAGNDIRDLRYNGQNNATGDVTRVVAGRDIAFGAGNRNYGIDIAGPGELEVVAGRNIDLGPSFGIVSEGNLINTGLADAGANVTVMTGIASDIDASLALIPADKTIGDLFKVLRDTGRAVAKGTGSFDPGYAEIGKDFPVASGNTDQGNLSMVQSRIYTLDGGDINILVPHGHVDVGVAQAAAGGTSKKPSELGIVAEKSGSIRAFTDGDFLVNSSRVFTLGGGDILIWSTNGNIDAGRGAKTTISAPEPTISIDAQGNVSQNFGAAVSGSGIRGILAVPGVKPGDVDLYAPRGFVSAGDAGIGSAGNITIAAVRVVGADNINFGGTAVGVPIDTGGLGASLASASSASSSASNSASSAAGSEDPNKAPLASEALSWLEVFVLGLGEDACRPDDVECIKRQKRTLN